jgi:hypothetical protein
VIVGAVDIEIVDENSKRLGWDLWVCSKGEDEGECECKSEEGADSYGLWPSEKEDAGVWKEVKPMCVELIVRCGVRLNWELRECDLDGRLWWSALRPIEAMQGGIMMVGTEVSVSGLRSQSASGAARGPAAVLDMERGRLIDVEHEKSGISKRWNTTAFAENAFDVDRRC